MWPTIGRIVLIQHHPSSMPTAPAIVTAVRSPRSINCRCFQDNSLSPQWYTNVPEDCEMKPGEIKPTITWCWPPRSSEALAKLNVKPETTKPDTEDAEVATDQQPSEAPIG